MMMPNQSNNTRTPSLATEKPIRNSKTKKISINAHFDEGRIRVDMVAGYETWILILLECEATPVGSVFPMKQVLPLFAGTKKQKQSIETYALREPDNFYGDLYRICRKVNSVNPRRVTLQRGTIHGKSAQTISEVKLFARHLYVVLKFWLKQNRSKWPKELHKYFSKNNIHLLTGEKKFWIAHILFIILNDRFKTSFRLRYLHEIKDWKSFYRRHIAYESLRNIKNYYSGHDYNLRFGIPGIIFQSPRTRSDRPVPNRKF